MASANGTHQPQGSFGEEPLADNELARLLRDREVAKKDLQPYRLAYKGLNDQVRASIEQKELANGTYRCGEFIVTVSETEEKEVAFERQAGRRISIRPAKTKA